MSLFQKAAFATLTTMIIILTILILSEMGTKREHQEFVVLVNEDDFEAPDPFVEEKKMKELDENIQKMLEQELRQDNRKNIAVNKAEEPDNKNHTQTRIRQNQTEEDYQKELIKNAIGDKDYEKFIENKPTFEEEEITVPQDNKPQKVEKEVYTGPSNIVFYLDNRKIVHINVPVYLCHGSADITVKIVVNSAGYVERAQIDEQESTSDDKCFTEAALQAARSARFSSNGPPEQTGKILFHFVAQ